jgi:hypothetical protein
MMRKRTVKRYFFISPSFQSMTMKVPQPAKSVNQQLKHLPWDSNRLSQNDPPLSTINQHHLLIAGYLKQVEGKTGGWMSI